MKKSLSHAPSRLSGHSGNSELFRSPLSKKDADGLDGVQRTTETIQRLGSCHTREGCESRVCAALGKGGFGKTLPPRPGWLRRRRRLRLYSEPRGKAGSELLRGHSGEPAAGMLFTRRTASREAVRSPALATSAIPLARGRAASPGPGSSRERRERVMRERVMREAPGRPAAPPHPSLLAPASLGLYEPEVPPVPLPARGGSEPAPRPERAPAPAPSPSPAAAAGARPPRTGLWEL